MSWPSEVPDKSGNWALSWTLRADSLGYNSCQVYSLSTQSGYTGTQWHKSLATLRALVKVWVLATGKSLDSSSLGKGIRLARIIELTIHTWMRNFTQAYTYVTRINAAKSLTISCEISIYTYKQTLFFVWLTMYFFLFCLADSL